MNNASLELGGDNWAAKDGNLLGYAVGDSSGKYVPNEFTFTRGSNLSATRVNEDGYIEKGYENLLLQSNSFDTSPWVSSNLNLSWDILPNQTGYDGSNNAWSIGKSVSSNGYWKQVINPTGLATHSLYAKSGSLNGLLIFGGAPVVRVNLDTGASYGFIRNLIYFNITSLDNGWKKIVFTCIDGGVNIQPQDADNNVSAAGNILIQNYQINQGLAALPYVETTTASVGAGILENEPRIDYSSGTASLLLEPQRTNIVPSMLFYSFNGVTYILSSTKIGEGMPMQHFTKASVGQYPGHIITGQSISSGDVIAFSMFFKPISAQNNFHKIQMSIQDQDSPIYYDYSRDGFFNDVSGTPLPSNKYVEEYANGVYRIVHIQTSTASANRINLNVDSYYNTTSQFLCGYAQVEQDVTYPTSYIPTYGVSQTRLNDYFKVINQEGLFGANEGTFFMEFAFNQNNKYIGIGDTFPSSSVAIGLNANATNRIRSIISNNGVTINLYGGDVTLGETIKACVSYGSSGFKLFMNGNLEASNATPSNLSQFSDLIPNVNVQDTSNSNNSGVINQLLVFPTALTDSECIELTTI